MQLLTVQCTWWVAQYTRSIMSRQTDDNSRRIATTHHRLSISDMLAIEHHPPHLYKCLWHHQYFRTRNIDIHCTFFTCLFVLFAGRHDPSLTGHPFWRPVTDWVYWTTTCTCCKVQRIWHLTARTDRCHINQLVLLHILNVILCCFYCMWWVG